MNFSEFFGLEIAGHADVSFVDVDLSTDTRLFLDASLIQGSEDSWCRQSHRVLDSFFSTVFGYCENDEIKKLANVMQYGHEPNETRLGLSESKPQGRGASPEMLVEIFGGIGAFLRGPNPLIVSPMDLCVFVKNFAEDRMSDLITNVLRKQLHEFTLQECERYDIPLSDQETEIGWYWDIRARRWKMLMGRSLIADGKELLLVPKSIIRHYYIYGVETYIFQFAIPTRQKYHLENVTNLAQLKHSKRRGDYYDEPTKKTVYKREIKGNDHKVYARKYCLNNPDTLRDFRASLIRDIKNGNYVLSDEQLDRIVY